MPGKTVKLPQEEEMPCLNQGDSNGCGTTCMAMILTYLLRKEVTQDQVDREIRRNNIFTSPGDLVRLAQKYGISAEAYNHGELEELRLHLEEGRPIQALIRGEAGLHYVVVSGLEDDHFAGTRVLCLDPANGNRRLIPKSLFLKAWKDLPVRFNNFFIAYSKEPSSLPPGRVDDVAMAMKVLNGVTQASNSLHSLLFPSSTRSWLLSLVELPSGVIQAILYAPFAILGIAFNKALKVRHHPAPVSN